MKIQFRWPPRPLGLGTPLNLALASPGTRSLLLRNWWLPLVAGVTASIAVLLVDQALFAGASLGRVREMGSQPLSTRLAIMILSAVEEELIYRVFIATLVAWLVWLAISHFYREPKQLAQWMGILVAAYLFGLAHVPGLANVAHPVLRAITVNGIAGIVLGWIYWWRGLELAIVTHMVAIATVYIVVPVFL
jgi:Type II CAAX prenyl endopeptidase Rce1-like